MLCEKCGHAVSMEYGQNKCPHCGAEINSGSAMIKKEDGLRPPSSEPYSQTQSAGQTTLSPTWDDEGPFFQRLWNTWKAAMFNPGTFFAQTPTNAGIGRPLLYAIIVGSIGMIASVLWQFLFFMMQIPFLEQQEKSFAMLSTLFTPVLLLILCMLTPVFIIIGAFIYSGILHISLMIVRGDEKGFEATFRSVTYSTSTHLFNIIPFCGGFIGGIWAIVLIIIGLKETHRISTGKAIAAFLMPIIFCCGCGIALFALGLFGSLFAAARPH